MQHNNCVFSEFYIQKKINFLQISVKKSVNNFGDGNPKEWK